MSAGEIEGAVVEQLRAVFRTPEMVAQTYMAATRMGNKESNKLTDDHMPPLNEREVAESLIKFDPIWDELFPLERQKIVKLLVEQVTVNQNELDVRIRTDGIHSLITELKCNDEQMEVR